MALIEESDIKLLKPERLTDYDDGGGKMTGNAVVDGRVNDLFPDISQLDRTYGRVSLRKPFIAVQTANTEPYLGCHVILSVPATDPDVSVVLFDTGSWTDERADARYRLENYLGKGSAYSGFLWGTQYQGSRAITIFQRTTARIPDVGETLVLVANAGLATEYSQFVRISKVEASVQQFTDVNGTFNRTILNLDITDALRDDYAGAEINRYDNIAPNAAIKNTVVANAATYYGVKPLSADAARGDLGAKVPDPFAPLVPATQAESPALDLSASPSTAVALATAPYPVTAQLAAHSLRTRIVEANRAYNYVFIMAPVPAPGSVAVAYRSQGRWYTLRDNGTGGMTGNGPGEGTGAVNYATGSISVTLGALPDTGSQVILQWGQTTEFTSRAGTVTIKNPGYQFKLSAADIDPASLVFTWQSGGVDKTAHGHADGSITGQATGYAVPTTGDVYVSPVAGAYPDAGSVMGVEYSHGVPAVEMKTATAIDRFVSLATDHPIAPGTLRVEWITTTTTSATSGEDDSVVNAASHKGDVNITTADPPVVYRASSMGGYVSGRT